MLVPQLEIFEGLGACLFSAGVTRGHGVHDPQAWTPPGARQRWQSYTHLARSHRQASASCQRGRREKWSSLPWLLLPPLFKQSVS